MAFLETFKPESPYYIVYNQSMITLPIILLAFGGISLGVASVYFYIFARSKERFIQFWGLCWVCYSCSLLLLILGEGYQALLILRKVFDMYNILFLLFGVYRFQNLRIPGFWTRFSLYLLIWAFLAALYQFDLMPFYLPASVFQISATIVICYLIGRGRQVCPLARIAAGFIFGTCGIV